MVDTVVNTFLLLLPGQVTFKIIAAESQHVHVEPVKFKQLLFPRKLFAQLCCLTSLLDKENLL